MRGITLRNLLLIKFFILSTFFSASASYALCSFDTSRFDDYQKAQLDNIEEVHFLCLVDQVAKKLDAQTDSTILAKRVANACHNHISFMEDYLIQELKVDTAQTKSCMKQFDKTLMRRLTSYIEEKRGKLLEIKGLIDRIKR